MMQHGLPKCHLNLKKKYSELVKGSGLSREEFLEQLISSYKAGLLQGSDASKIDSDCCKDKLDLETLMTEIYARNKELERAIGI